jgi:hypothetical protein
MGGDDFLRVGGPDEGLWVMVDLFDVAVDGALQVIDGADR